MNHEGGEGREGFHPFSMRLPTPLSPEVEDAMKALQGEKAVTVKYRDVEIFASFAVQRLEEGVTKKKPGLSGISCVKRR